MEQRGKGLIMKKIKLLDAFAGIGGFHLGIQQTCAKLGLDFECMGAIEKNKHSQFTYQDNFPSVPIFDDITKIKVENLPKHTILTGGFPCQPFSSAGLAHITNGSQVRSEDDRSNLYLYLVEILKYHKPEYFIFENVKGLQTIQIGNKYLLKDIILPSLQNLGYNVEVDILTPCDFGLPQLRERLFIVGCRNSVPSLPIKQQNTSCLRDILETNIDESYYLDNKWKNIFLTIKPDGSRYLDTDIKPTRLSALYENLNEREQKYKIKQPNKSKTVLAAEVTNDTPSGRSRQHDRAYCVDGQCPTLTTVDAQIIYEPHTKRFRKLTPLEYARLQGFVSNTNTFKIHKNDNVAYHQFGNAVCVKVVNNITRSMLSNV